MKTLTKQNYKKFIEGAEAKNAASGKLISKDYGLKIIPTEIGDEYNPRVRFDNLELMSFIIESYKIKGCSDNGIKNIINNMIDNLLENE